MQKLIDPFMQPVVPASEPYISRSDVVSINVVEQPQAVFEVYSRHGGTFGIRCIAWVGYRDAGGDVRFHSWDTYSIPISLIAGSRSEAELAAEQFATSVGVTLGNWAPPANNSLQARRP